MADAVLNSSVPVAAEYLRSRCPAREVAAENKQLLSAAAAAARTFSAPNARIYWADLIATSIVAYGAFAATLAVPLGWLTLVFGTLAALAFYRGLSFIHELTHIRRDKLPGFFAAWNVLIGIPLLTPSFMYDDVHTQHHAKTTYGTAQDPEYLPLASMGRTAIGLFVLVSALAPLGFLLRFALLGPASVLSRRLRHLVVERYSALAINPQFRRRPPSGEFAREWRVLETATCLWALVIISFVGSGLISLSTLAIGLAVGAGIAVVNQVRTLAAHLWENEGGEPMSLTAQYLDSVNVPPPATLPALWAPIGLRYHALHHLLPSVPYHALGQIHRQLTLQLDGASAIRKADHRSLNSLLWKLVRKPRPQSIRQDVWA